MTTIIINNYKGNKYIAADMRVSADYGQVVSDKYKKIVELEHIIYAAAGNVGMAAKIVNQLNLALDWNDKTEEDLENTDQEQIDHAVVDEADLDELLVALMEDYGKNEKSSAIQLGLYVKRFDLFYNLSFDSSGVSVFKVPEEENVGMGSGTTEFYFLRSLYNLTNIKQSKLKKIFKEINKIEAGTSKEFQLVVIS